MNLLINPPAMIQSGYTPPPLGLLYLAAMDPDTVIWDAALCPDDVDAVLERLKPELVGVPIYTPGRHDSLRLLERAHVFGAQTVAGGPHVNVMVQQLIDHYGHFIDHFVIGDGEVVWYKLCQGEDLPQLMRSRICELDDLPHPAWDRVELSKYPPRAHGLKVMRGNDLRTEPRISIILGRGCDGACDFCSAYWVNGKYRHHSADWVTVDLRYLWQKGFRHLVWQDDCFTADRETVLELCERLQRYNFCWHATTRPDCFDEELAKAMAAAGCYGIAFGIESGSPRMLQLMNKRTDLATAFSARNACRKVGIQFGALMIEGYPGETAETKQQTREFLGRLQPDGIGTIGQTWVLPGTALYARCKRAGLIGDDFWLGPEPCFVCSGDQTFG